MSPLKEYHSISSNNISHIPFRDDIVNRLQLPQLGHSSHFSLVILRRITNRCMLTHTDSHYSTRVVASITQSSRHGSSSGYIAVREMANNIRYLRYPLSRPRPPPRRKLVFHLGKTMPNGQSVLEDAFSQHEENPILFHGIA